MTWSIWYWTADSLSVWVVARDGDELRQVSLDGAGLELPLLISMQHWSPKIGRVARSSLWAAPESLCSRFLPLLGRTRVWKYGWQRFDAAAAVSLAIQHVRDQARVPRRAALLWPDYLRGPSARQLAELFTSAGFQVVTSDSHAALATGLPLSWTLHTDSHASLLYSAQAGNAVRTYTECSLAMWQERTLAAIAELCIQRCRRDPRAVPQADQALGEQLDAIWQACLTGRVMRLQVGGRNWDQELEIHPELVEAACRPLADRLIQSLPGGTVWLDAVAARLPGLRAAATARSLKIATVPTLAERLSRWAEQRLTRVPSTHAPGKRGWFD